MKSQKALDALAKVTKDDNLDLRMAAVKALWYYNDAVSLSLLKTALNDPSPLVRYQVVVDLTACDKWIMPRIC